MILDATAGNRTMWTTKDAENIVYIDIERKLERKPTIFADNAITPFLDKTFDAIFYDPPHGWGAGHPFFSIPDHKTFHKIWPGYGAIPRYYGWDKHNSKEDLISSIFYAQREFMRILKDDGMLWIKWNETNITLHNILTIFTNWTIMMKLYISAPSHTAGEHQTYWVMLCKKRGKAEQVTLL